MPILRIVVIWIVTAVTLLALSVILSDVTVEDVGVAFVAAALIGLLNALVWPLLIRVALPLTVLTLGLGVIVLNGAMVLLVSELEPGLQVSSLFAGVVVALCLTVTTTVATSLMAVDDDPFWYRNVVRRQARRVGNPQPTDVPGLFFLEIDGLAHDVLLRAVRDGNAPTLARWLREGSHRLTRWETDWSSQTGACQAGLLHGDNDDMPAFRWWEKETGKPIVTNHPRDAAELERRHSDGRGLLFSNGASRANILSGDAPHSLLTMSTALRRDRPGRIGQDYFAYFANPYNVMRTTALVIREVVSERWSAAQQRRRDVQPRIHRSFVYSLMRSWATIIQRDLQVEAVIADMYAGLPVAYTTFLAYDEVAHHSGIERPEALTTLASVDRQIGRIAAAREHAPRPYRLVVLSDHGQSQGATFKDRYGRTLDDLVREAADGAVAVGGHPDEAIGFLGASLTEASSGDSRVARVVRRGSRSRTVDGAVELEPSGRTPPGAGQGDGEGKVPEVVAMASGCLGLVSFPREPGRMTLEALEERYPRVVPTLRDHPGIGFLLVRSSAHGAVALGAAGANFLDEGRVEGEDPLAPFGPNAARHVRRTDGFAHCADIMVNSAYWPEMDEVAAFEELVGSHGGMGGTQSFPFLMHPSDLELRDGELIGAEAVHRELRRWLVELGHEEYDAPAVA
ncbi:MAG TPA: phage holin family protein [Solirubrobacteraceae bacterium]|nr:phage holin family protein [Solirubrobacteraceae bacterium]